MLLHMKEVIDRGPLMMEGTGFYPDEDEDPIRKHTFKTWRGKIDGTGPGLNGSVYFSFLCVGLVVFNPV